MEQPDRVPKTLRLEVLSLGSGGLTLEGITSLQIKLADGSWLGIRPGHAPIIAATDDGDLKYRQGHEEHTVHVRSGIMTLTDNMISILTTH